MIKRKKICMCIIFCIFCNICTFSGPNENEVYATSLESKNEVNKELNIENSASVMINNNYKIFQTNISKKGVCRLEIKNNTGPVTIKAYGKNIYNGSYELGTINDETKEVLNNNNKLYKTSKWIQVYPGQTLTISGSGV
ncbi:MAG: hypothetical protein H7Y18_18630, partial [Clostridiaceae bacterium]|nr:hypothetical protein [Clostridiaceae bacterium]